MKASNEVTSVASCTASIKAFTELSDIVPNGSFHIFHERNHGSFHGNFHGSAHKSKRKNQVVQETEPGMLYKRYRF